MVYIIRKRKSKKKNEKRQTDFVKVEANSNQNTLMRWFKTNRKEI